MLRLSSVCFLPWFCTLNCWKAWSWLSAEANVPLLYYLRVKCLTSDIPVARLISVEPIGKRISSNSIVHAMLQTSTCLSYVQLTPYVHNKLVEGYCGVQSRLLLHCLFGKSIVVLPVKCFAVIDFILNSPHITIIWR